MTVNRAVRSLAGFVVLLSLVLAQVTGQIDLTKMSWLWLTLFVGLNLLQSGFTGFCPPDTILRKFGVPDAKPGCSTGSCD